MIGAAFKKAVDYAQDFSNKIQNTSALAKFSKTSIQSLDALQKAFQKFDVPEDVFLGFYEKLTLGIKEASRGVNNEFRQLVTQSNGAVRLLVDGQLTTSKQAIDDIFKYIRSISDESEKIRIVENVFGVGVRTAENIVQLSNLTKSEFDQLIEKEKQSLELLNDQQKAAQGFKQQINQLNTEWDKFKGNVAAVAIPVINQALGGANVLAEKAKEEGVGSAISFIGSSFQEVFAKFLGEDHLTRLKRESDVEKEDFTRRLFEYQTGAMNSQANVTNNNKFEFNVPPGTTEQQATFLAEAVKTTISSFWDEKVREVINNNPQVE